MNLKGVALVFALLLMWDLKRFYADAPVDELGWMLEPTARTTTVITGIPFEREAGEGYVSRERMFAIEKACAGVNFMIAAFGMIVYVLSRRAKSALSIGGILCASLAVSYAAAVLVNALRISFALWLASHPARVAWMAPSQVHRFEGIVVYFGGLVLLYEAAQRFDRRLRPARRTA
jgi:exosortase K